MAISPLRIVHVNANCSNLARSLAFYTELVGLAAMTHTNPVPQRGEAFGLEGEVQWDAHLLHDDRGPAGPALDLLEWRRPSPIGRPPRDANQLGFFRLCLSHPELDGLHERLASAGVPCRSGPTPIPGPPGETLRFFWCEDPDGITIEFIERPGPARLLHVNVNCVDLERSSAWYREVLGLAPLTARAESGPCEGKGFGFAGGCSYRADLLAVPAEGSPFAIDLLQWLEPTPVGRPLAQANHLGLFRLALLVEDARASCAELDRLEVAHSGACWLDMGPEIPIDGLYAVFFRDPDGACIELIEAPVLQPA